MARELGVLEIESASASAASRVPLAAAAPAAPTGSSTGSVIPTGTSRKELVYLNGLRFLLSSWIVCEHFSPQTHGFLHAARYRGSVAVHVFVMMSGFVTHWAYGARMPTECTPLRQFYIRRFGRVIITTWFTMFLHWAIMHYLFDKVDTFGHVFRCFLFVETWLHPEPHGQYCPNGASWTVAALLPSWLLYPVTCQVLNQVGAKQGASGVCGLLMLGLLLLVLTVGPLLLAYVRHDHFLTIEQGHWGYLWPPAQMPPWALGAVVAALAQRAAPGEAKEEESEPSAVQGVMRAGWGFIATLVALAMAYLVLMVPNHDYRAGYEPLYYQSLAPLTGLWLYGACVAEDSRTNLIAKLCSHDTCVTLGAFSFEVYLFQQPINELFLWFFADFADKPKEVPIIFVLFVVTVFTTAGLYSRYVQSWLIKWLRSLG